ncbi:MAG TPA: hypothetical protein PKV41_04545 [Candidatus Omnitrophota bacterium]|nr:hypothetical protein [Candidatus Omnitrophota bacterium]
MSKRMPWLWMVYAVLVAVFTVRETYYFFVPDSEISLYFLILRAFDPVFYLAYAAYVLRLLLTLIHCLPIWLYAYRIRFLPTAFWQYLFFGRCLFEILGNAYEITSLVAFSHNNPKLVWIAPAIMLSPLIPSYIVCYWYAFGQEKVFAKME